MRLADNLLTAKKSNSIFHKLSQRHINKAHSTRTKLTKDEQKRLSKLEDITERLKHRENVQNDVK